MTTSQALTFSDDMRAILASLMISPNAIPIELAAARAGIEPQQGRIAALYLLQAGFVRRRGRGHAPITWEILPHPGVLEAVGEFMMLRFKEAAARSPERAKRDSDPKMLGV